MKRHSPKVIHCINHGIFPGHTMFMCGFTYDEIVKELKRQKAYDWLGGLEGKKEMLSNGNRRAFAVELENTVTGVTKSLFYIFYPNPFTYTDFDYCALAHEVLHICQFFLPAILDRNREIEAEAYLHTHLMEQCLKHLQR